MSELKYSKEQIIDACKEAGLGILECNSLITVLGCCQPEATKPAQDLSAAIMNIRCEMPPALSKGEAYQYKLGHRDARHAAAELANEAALASPADALVAGDRVDAERYRFLSTLVYPEKFYASGHPSWVIRYHLRGETFNSAIDTAIQAQKDGHAE